MGIKIVAENKKVRFDYHIIETYEAGLVLQGSEVKSLRDGSVNLKDSYISFQGQEAFLQKAHISIYNASSYNNHHPERLRKLLLHKAELNKIHGKIKEKGLTCVPLKVYFKDGKAKLEIALVKGKTKGDKRDTITKRDASREIQRSMRKDRS
jgi:SsrA-binding protein